MKNKIFGILILLIALFCLWYYGHMVFNHFYYGNAHIYCFRPPIYVSIINTILSGFGILIGVKTYRQRIKWTATLIALISIVFLAILRDNFGYTFYEYFTD